MSQNRLARSSTPGVSALQKTISKKFLLTSYIIISFLFLFSEKSDFRAIRFLKALINDGITYSIYVVNTPVKLISNLGSSARQYFNFNIILENKKLKDEIEQLNAEKRELQFFKNENDNLKRVLGIKNRDDYVSVYAKIIHEDTNEFAKNLILTIGSNEGVQLGQAIVRNNVYLGKISEVNLFSSKAMVITDLNSRVPVVIPSRGVNAILKGNGLGGAQLLFLPQNAVFENNDQIYTSGSDGIIKEGLYVGKIITDNKKDIKKRKYSVDLGFKEHQLNYVSVLKVKK
ncbi:MAG: rod shape-determining protein MreC [Candidatus Fonsibacter sp.]|nr:rod shape-determining protein MreC [Candidatus Fonsibacter sp.]